MKIGFNNVINPESNNYKGSLPDLEWIRENTVTIEFEFWYPDGEAIDCTSGVNVFFVMSPYQQPNNPLLLRRLPVSQTEKNVGVLSLIAEDTKDLDAYIYSYQVYLQTTDYNQQKYIMSDGTIDFNMFISDRN